MNVGAFFCEKFTATAKAGKFDIAGVGLTGFPVASLGQRVPIVILVTLSKADRGVGLLVVSVRLEDGSTLPSGIETLRVAPDGNAQQLWIDGFFRLDPKLPAGKHRLEIVMNEKHPMAQLPFEILV